MRPLRGFREVLLLVFRKLDAIQERLVRGSQEL